MEGEDTRRVGAGDGAEEGPAGKGPEHEGQRHPAAPGRADRRRQAER